jgi:hypothetical protein
MFLRDSDQKELPHFFLYAWVDKKSAWAKLAIQQITSKRFRRILLTWA